MDRLARTAGLNSSWWPATTARPKILLARRRDHDPGDGRRRPRADLPGGDIAEGTTRPPPTSPASTRRPTTSLPRPIRTSGSRTPARRTAPGAASYDAIYMLRDVISRWAPAAARSATLRRDRPVDTTVCRRRWAPGLRRERRRPSLRIYMGVVRGGRMTMAEGNEPAEKPSEPGDRGHGHPHHPGPAHRPVRHQRRPLAEPHGRGDERPLAGADAGNGLRARCSTKSAARSSTC
jgi:hypothetical protein